MTTYKIATWDSEPINDGTNYRAWFPEHDERGLPTVDAQMVERTGYWPILGSIRRLGHQVVMKVSIEGASVDALRAQLLKWFVPQPNYLDWTGAAAKRLVIEDRDGSNDRYIMATPISCTPAPERSDVIYTIILQAHGDPRWRGVNNASFSTWNLSAGSGINAFNPASQDIVFPIIDITPNGAKSGDYAYKVFVPIQWRTVNSGRYPIDIGNATFDTAALTTAKMQADGDDLRVLVNGAERDRWLGNMDTTTTRVWVNLEFAANVEMTLAAAIASGGSVDSITVNQNLYGLANSGIVQIGSEFFTYTGVDGINKTLTGVERATHFSSAAAHSVGDSVIWIQHEVYIIYGNATATAPITNDAYKPMFDLDTSTNGSWIYTDFFEAGAQRAGAWRKEVVEGSIQTPLFYGDNQGPVIEPATTFAELGVVALGAYPYASWGIFRLANPCGVTAANFTNGEQWAGALSGTTAEIVYYPASTNQAQAIYEIPQPPATHAWQSWSRNQTITAANVGVGLSVRTPGSLATMRKVEAADVTLTLDSNKTPVVTPGSEQGGYQLNLTLTTLGIQTAEFGGLQLNINFMMEVGQTLRVDTYNKTVTYLKDNSNQAQAITLLGAIRRDWWPLVGGQSQSVSAEDTGTTDLDIDISYTPRYFT